MEARSRFSQSAIPDGHTACGPTKKTVVRDKKKKEKKSEGLMLSQISDLMLSQISAFRLPPPFSNHGRIYPSIQIKSESEMVSYPGGLHSSGLSPLLFPEIVYAT